MIFMKIYQAEMNADNQKREFEEQILSFERNRNKLY